MRRFGISAFSVIVGFALLLLNLFGLFIGQIDHTYFPEKPIAGYHYRTLNKEEAIEKFISLKNTNISDKKKAKELLKLVSDSFFHKSIYEIKPWDNWIMWVGGLLYEPLLDSQDADLLWARGGGPCHQASIIYITKAKELGFDARLISLDGHVVAEVNIPNVGWRVADPDYGIFWPNSLDAFGRNIKQKDIVHILISKGYSEQTANKFAEIYISQENNKRVEFPNAPNRYKFEKAMSFAKWLFPLLLIGIGLSGLSKRLSRSIILTATL